MNSPAYISKAITDALNAPLTPFGLAVWSIPFLAVREYSPNRRLENIGTDRPTVIVAPLSLQSTPVDRSSNYDDIDTTVWVLKKIDPDDIADQDAIVDLADQVQFKLRRFPITGYSWIGLEWTITIPAWLQTNHVIGSVITTKYKAVR